MCLIIGRVYTTKAKVNIPLYIERNSIYYHGSIWQVIYMYNTTCEFLIQQRVIDSSIYMAIYLSIYDKWYRYIVFFNNAVKLQWPSCILHFCIIITRLQAPLVCIRHSSIFTTNNYIAPLHIKLKERLCVRLYVANKSNDSLYILKRSYRDSIMFEDDAEIQMLIRYNRSHRVLGDYQISWPDI